MEPEDVDEEEFGFSRNYFLAKELGTSSKKSGRKVTDIDLVDEQVNFLSDFLLITLFRFIYSFNGCKVPGFKMEILWYFGFFVLMQELREAVANIEPKHEKEIDELIKSYKSLYEEWVLELRFCLLVVALGNADSTCFYV